MENINNKMKNNFFYSKSGLSASMLFNKLCETARIYSNYERIIKYTYRVNARVYTGPIFTQLEMYVVDNNSHIMVLFMT